MDKIIGLGNALVDVLATLDDDGALRSMGLPKGGMTLIDGPRLSVISGVLSRMDTHLSTGGSAGNTIAALAALGAPTAFVGKVGTDRYGAFLRHSLRARGTEDRLIEDAERPSGVAHTFISPDGERTFATHLGAASALRASDFTPATFAGYDCLYVEGYLVQDHDMIARAMQLAKQAGLRVCLDMASYNVVRDDRDFFAQLLTRYVDTVFANEEEARAFTGREPEQALHELARTCPIAVVKVGSRGALVQRGTEVVSVPATHVPTVRDTTGAGDFFAAGFLYGLTCGLDLERCGQIGARVSGEVIQIIGTTLPRATWTAIKDWIQPD